jgi:hypothetical protein
VPESQHHHTLPLLEGFRHFLTTFVHWHQQ